jgi:hypothetical protein
MKEAHMMYKTIVLGVLQDHPLLYDRLLTTRTLLSMLHDSASELKSSHLRWKERLAQAMPGTDPAQIASEALELALEEMEKSLGAPASKDEPELLKQAMAYLLRSTEAA